MFTLRPYQAEAKGAVYDHLRTRNDNPCVVIPTGGGKTPLLASICKDAVTQWGGRVIVLAHVKELVEQSVDKLRHTCPEVDVGVNSAGLGRRDTDASVIVAGIQSVYKRACELGPFDLVIVDEAHRIPESGEGMYCQFLREARVVNPQLRVIGMTATPFRLETGMICTPDHFLNHICYEIGVLDLIRDGYLAPLSTKEARTMADTSGLHVRGGEFVPGEVESLMDQDPLVDSACAEIVEYTAGRRAVLIFATGVKHGKHIVRVLRDKYVVECGFICAKTSAVERRETIERFKTGSLKFLANVNVLTTGFDAPNVDCVALLRPTASTGLYYQMVGRGFRLHPGKADCLVLDFGGNVERHGPVDQLRIEELDFGDGDAPTKACPACETMIATGFATCPECGYEFPPPNRRPHEAEATEAGILSGAVTDTEYDIQDITYAVHTKRGAKDTDPKTLRVKYRVGLNHWQSEWVCFEHTGYARAKAVAWWRQRSPDPVPDTAKRAVEIAEGGGLAQPEKITVRHIAGDKFDQIVACNLGPIPEPLSVHDAACYDEDEIPF